MKLLEVEGARVPVPNSWRHHCSSGTDRAAAAPGPEVRREYAMTCMLFVV